MNLDAMKSEMGLQSGDSARTSVWQQVESKETVVKLIRLRTRSPEILLIKDEY